MEQTFLSVLLSKDLAHRARIEAAKRNVSRSEFVRRAVVEFLRQIEQSERLAEEVQ